MSANLRELGVSKHNYENHSSEQTMNSKVQEQKVHALSAESEFDFRRKSGPIELICVFKSSGGYDIYHPSDVPQLIQRLPNGEVALHKGKQRVGEVKEKFDAQLKAIGCDQTALKNTVMDPEDVELTEVEITTGEKLGIDFKDVTNDVETITYARLSSFRCCIPSPFGAYYC
jgi:hypothetical protein